MDRDQSYHYSLSHQANFMSQKRVGTDKEAEMGDCCGEQEGRSSRLSA